MSEDIIRMLIICKLARMSQPDVARERPAMVAGRSPGAAVIASRHPRGN
jgi:hypothetical protein